MNHPLFITLVYTSLGYGTLTYFSAVSAAVFLRWIFPPMCCVIPNHTLLGTKITTTAVFCWLFFVLFLIRVMKIKWTISIFSDLIIEIKSTTLIIRNCTSQWNLKCSCKYLSYPSYSCSTFLSNHVILIIRHVQLGRCVLQLDV